MGEACTKLKIIATYMKPTLFVLAAGMGSRYGGLKQLDQLGAARPNHYGLFNL